MKTIYERIAKVLQDSGKLQAEFADSIGVTSRTLFTYLKARSKVSVDALQSICQVYGVNANWLLTGEGSIYIDDVCENAPKVVEPKKDDTIDEMRALMAVIESQKKQIDSLLTTNAQLVSKLVEK